jgi:hypothetical protein
MKAVTPLAILVAIGSMIAAAQLWKSNQALHLEIAALRAQGHTFQEQAETAAKASTAEAAQAQVQSEAQTRELMKLRGEVSQLRTGGAQELQQLRAENAVLKREASRAGASRTLPGLDQSSDTAKGQFPRESWSFAGYKSPENALVSAIWSMREGDPKTYFNSLTPEEQSRLAKQWENKPESEIAAKHQSDVSKITSMQILDRQPVSDDEMTMSVYIGGVDRTEKVRMQRSQGEWKFGGFIRDPQKQ